MARNIQVNVDSAKLSVFTQQLRKMHRKELPLAIRNTLTDVAVETKKNIPNSAKRKFTVRNPGFFKAFTGFEKATGLRT